MGIRQTGEYCYNQGMRKGFTLIELLVVIAIIGILSSIILTNLTSSRAKARDAQRISDLGQLQLALELYYDRCNQYPPADSSNSYSYIDNNTLAQSQGCPSGITFGSFISQVSNPPAGGSVTRAHYDYITGNAYGGTRNDYLLHTALEYSNSAQQNSLQNVPSDITLPIGVACYNGSNLNYCVGPK